MKAFEFSAKLSADGLAVPAEVASQISPDQRIRVILLVPDEKEDSAWANLTSEQFLKGYAASDSIYDKLSAG